MTRMSEREAVVSSFLSLRTDGEAMVAASGGAFAAWELGLYLWGRTAKEDAMKLKPRHAVRGTPIMY